MVEQQEQHAERNRGRRQRIVGAACFATGFLGALAFFAFFPGMPHVIDWGAILVSIGVGAAARWGGLVWVGRVGGK
ncbi:hypothetical protein ACLGIH_19075 [Streptomyces sp. HMX87]|uniref:hypothetical protein n=1 Tax=Streptomyces sp. HMX87 TaxID=3390849 RepID=UPI003A87EB48